MGGPGLRRLKRLERDGEVQDRCTLQRVDVLSRRFGAPREACSNLDNGLSIR